MLRKLLKYDLKYSYKAYLAAKNIKAVLIKKNKNRWNVGTRMFL